MADFKYQVRDNTGQMRQGVVEAESEERAVEALHRRGFTILAIEGENRGLFEKDLGGYLSKPTRRDLVMFTRQLSTLIDAEVPLVEGLHTLSEQSEKSAFREIIEEISNDIQGGASLSQAISKHKLFGRFYVSLVRAGEISGRLQETLIYLADYLERVAEINSKIKGALAYPIFVLVAIFGVGVIMMTTVLPQLLTILTEAGVADLPLSTRILIFTTNLINNYIVVFIAGLIALGFGLRAWVKTPAGRFKLDMLKIKFPRLGTVARNIYLARIAETLATLIKAGVPILEGLKITSEIVGHALYEKILLEAQASVQGGGTISEVFQKYEEIPALVSSMMAIGEKTGKTDFMLENVHKFYKSEAERDIQSISQLIEPILVLFLGGIVFIMVSSILLPIYNLVGAA
ncbi:MAG: hypothetical protein COV31_02560 [Candidatus Yanofskybacteria bacterium CG10_big_fil_rev_8_21_14_0_10_46_23]|uniref:Type II secretion system protein GspF domain-containing protein n=1 Tax=Candidatus Yanofskybacteria bacterium CG10_big_fil_rev_8_21_14_0_10_46_23 TaxID=1975098 RepID=A0A2H0R423_9BACT|nr:MAG: hypothetical protein COV31_02560 [Candidatus Yanofskybacteria bacterium CG10_big_fil_rev_8_21_14_0_10_46_23]